MKCLPLLAVHDDRPFDRHHCYESTRVSRGVFSHDNGCRSDPGPVGGYGSADRVTGRASDHRAVLVVRHGPDSG